MITNMAYHIIEKKPWKYAEAKGKRKKEANCLNLLVATEKETR
jgi:hypothetical protein